MSNETKYSILKLIMCTHVRWVVVYKNCRCMGEASNASLVRVVASRETADMGPELRSSA